VNENLIDQVDAILPQTQCGECQYPGCRPYAQAMVNEGVEINRCPPGGTTVLIKLAELLKRDANSYVEEVRAKTRPPATAIIREEECIGCTKCIQACPIDAIIGTAKQMHVILSDECTGCGLCVEPCPVDCIDIKPLTTPAYDPVIAKQRHEARAERLIVQNKERLARHQRAQHSRQDYLQSLLARQKKSDSDE
jgi:Na+-translocating ferredoxin:NAD+ oxidoreductase subunit B